MNIPKKTPPQVVGLVLTLNEELHLDRCLTSLRQVCDHIVVVDCYSKDRTLEIAAKHGAFVLQHAWTNHSTQCNWALDQIHERWPETPWVMRLDADEYLTEALTREIQERMPSLSSDLAGVYLRRRMAFQGRLIRHGGVFPVRIMRLFRNGQGRSENRWMDEHILIDGNTAEFKHEFIDDNRQSLTWWTQKHNRYASFEAIDILNREYRFMQSESAARLTGGGRTGMKRWVKEEVYWRMPSGLRALMYFLYRYVIRLGFLDGREGTAFHALQGLWYRYLVDQKVEEVRRAIRTQAIDARAAIRRVLDVELP